jgi:DNA polymerase-3 subunit gamma/tau
MAYDPLHHKYRPQTFAELVGQEAIATTLTNALLTQRIAPAYLFTGPRGTGKTSSARILAKSLNCQSVEQPTPSPCGKCEVCRMITKGNALDVIEIDAASNTGVDNIREIIERSQFAPVQCRYKVYVIDECHMLSTAAFNALLKTLEEPPPRVVFVLATTDPQRVLPTIISRCQRFDYRRIPLESMVKHLHDISQKENIDIEYEAINLVAQIANGGLRDAESLLDQLSLSSETVTVDKVWDLVGAVPEQDLISLLKAIKDDNSTTVIDQCRHLMNRGREPLIVLQNLASFYLNLLIAKTAPNRQDMVAVTNPTWKELCEEAQRWELSLILLGQQHLKENEYQLKNTTQPRLWLEITILGLLPSAQKTVTIVSNVNNNVTNNPVASSTPKIVTQPVPETPKTPVTNSEPKPVNQPQKPIAEPSQIEPKQPEAIAIPEEPETEPISDHISYEQLWQKVINNLFPPITQVLLKQHCTLIDFQDNIAVIGVRSEGLLKQAKDKQFNIETAFEKVCQQKIIVRLIVTSEHPEKINHSLNHNPSPKLSEPKPTNLRIVPDPPISEPKPPNLRIVPDPPISEPKPPVLTIVKETTHSSPKPLETNSKNSDYNYNDLVKPQPENSPLEAKTEVQTSVTDLSKIAENLAKAFNGEVIDVELRFKKELLTESQENPTPETI